MSTEGGRWSNKAKNVSKAICEKKTQEKSGFVETCDEYVLRHAEWGHVREKCW